MKLTDVYPLEKWVVLEQAIHDRIGLDANVFGVDGVRISEFKAWVNRLCPAIKATDKGQSFICAVAHMNLAAMAKNSGEAVVEECDAGLVKIVIPIRANGEFLGAVGACGLLMDDGEVDTFLVNKITDIDEDKAESLARDIGSIPSAKIDELIVFVENELAKITKNTDA